MGGGCWHGGYYGQRQSARIGLLVATANNLEVRVGGVGNAYMHSYTRVQPTTGEVSDHLEGTLQSLRTSARGKVARDIHQQPVLAAGIQTHEGRPQHACGSRNTGMDVGVHDCLH